MKKFVVAFVLSLVLCASLQAANNQAFWGMFAETSLTMMPGMPSMPDMPGLSDEDGGEEIPDMSDLPDMGDIDGMPENSGMSNMPNMANIMSMMSMGKPQRSFNIRLWSPGIAPDNAFATVAPPDGLKQGKTLELEIYRPKSVKKETTDGGSGGEDETPDIKKFTILLYWGSSEKVRAGQPKVITFDGMNADQKAAMEKQIDKAAKNDPYYYKPDWTTAYWPTKKQPGKIAKDAVLPGNFALTTNYTGSIALDVPVNVSFLDHINMVSPDMKKPVLLDSFIPFKWDPIANVLGFHAQIIGMKGEDTLIIWSSSEKTPELAQDWDYLEMAVVKQFVKDGIMMKGTQTSVTVPEAIFKDCEMTMFKMIGYGTGTALPEGQPLPRLQTKTTLSVTPLGGNMMQDMMGGEMPEFDGEADE